MFFKTIDKKIKKSFSSAALQYDVLSSLHREIGRDLTSRIVFTQEPQAILDIGMGTGWFTNRLKNQNPDALVVGFDFAQGMIEQSKKRDSDFHCLLADAKNLPFKKEKFDLITSNLAYQWVSDFEKGFKDCKELLSQEGVLQMTMFGYNTLEELFISLHESLEQKAEKLGITRLAKEEDLKSALNKCGFKDVSVVAEKIKVRFPDMFALLKWIKNIGANSLEKDIFIGKEHLNRANQYYLKHFTDTHGPYATFEVVWLKATK